jgi:hypothetical protein
MLQVLTEELTARSQHIQGVQHNRRLSRAFLSLDAAAKAEVVETPACAASGAEATGIY